MEKLGQATTFQTVKNFVGKTRIVKSRLYELRTPSLKGTKRQGATARTANTFAKRHEASGHDFSRAEKDEKTSGL